MIENLDVTKREDRDLLRKASQISMAKFRDLCYEAFDHIDNLDKLLAYWNGVHANLVQRMRLLSQRPDLPVDRLPAYREMERLQERERKLCALEAAGVDNWEGYEVAMEALRNASCNGSEPA